MKSKKSGETYFLHCRSRTKKDGGETLLYFFSKSEGESAVDDLPQGYIVSENAKTGLPLLKRK